MSKAAAVSAPDVIAEVAGLSLAYGKTIALREIDLAVPAGRMVGLIGPDGVGKSSLLSLMAGARMMQDGSLRVLGGDMRDAEHRRAICPRVAYMPQGLGKNLYPTLSVFENADFFGRLFGHNKAERERRISELLAATGMSAFRDRPAAKLSGGMKQKLGLICALIHDPDFLILDEPTTGVDPLSRRQFWSLIDTIRAERPGMSVIVATAYMEEAADFDWLVAMNAGQILATGTTAELLARTATSNLDDAFIALLPESARQGHHRVAIAPLVEQDPPEFAIEAEGLTMRFGDFAAVNNVSFRIRKGEIFGFLGSNGCGKTTTMKMLTGLLEPSEGSARLFGAQIDPKDMAVRRRVGFMSQAFSLYSELTVIQNLELHARLFGMQEEAIPPRVQEMAEKFGLLEVMHAEPEALPLGLRQRLSLAVAMIHGPEILILDEPTSGVDPVARDNFWHILGNLSREDGVTIFVSTHFMNEAELCDRISLMHAGKVLISDTASNITAHYQQPNLNEAFVACLAEAMGESLPARQPPATEISAADMLSENIPASDIPAEDTPGARPAAPPAGDPPITATHITATPTTATPTTTAQPAAPAQQHSFFSLNRMFSYAILESLQLRRDPIRLALSLFGTLLLMFVIGYGMNMDIDELDFAVLDRDQTSVSRDYIADLSGSRYFTAQPPLADYEELDRRMREGELALAIEIPPGFASDMTRGRDVEIGAWIDGSNPTRAETVRSYVQGIHANWLTRLNRERFGDNATAGDFSIETRYRYNPDIKSIIAIAPAIMPLLLLMIPAMLTSLAVVREKELGSIINLYVTPVTRLEFLLGKQLPYIALAMLNFIMLTAFIVFIFRVPFTGSFLTFALFALIYVAATTAIGLLISTFISTQIAAIFGTTLATILPGVQYSGLINPVSSLQGIGRSIGEIYPATHFITASRGSFSKALGFADLTPSLTPLLIAVPVLVGLSTILLKKQAK